MKCHVRLFDDELLAKIVLCLCWIATWAVLGWVLLYCGYGFDLTDEAFYLLSMQQPHLPRNTITLFGFFFHPLYLWTAGDISLLRRVNVLLLLLLSLSLAGLFLKKNRRITGLGGYETLILACALALASAFQYTFFIYATPNYNTLAFCGLLVTLCGALLVDSPVRAACLGGWLIAAVGVWLAFLGKPSTALLLAPGFLGYLLFAGHFRLGYAAVASLLGLGLLLATAYLIDSSLSLFFERMRFSAHLAALLGGGHNILDSLRFDELYFTRGERSLFFLGFTALMAGALAQGTVRNCFLPLVLVLGLAAALWLGMGTPQLPFRMKACRPAVVLCVPLACMALAALIRRRRVFCALKREEWAFFVFSMFLPYAFAFGSNNNYWMLGGQAGLFWILGGVHLALRTLKRQPARGLLYSLAAVLPALVCLVLAGEMSRPYRQGQPLRENTAPTLIGAPGSTLVLSRQAAGFFADLARGADEGGFSAGTALIDLTGRSPGVVYFLRAKIIGSAWFLGGYKGSDAVAREILGRVACEDAAGAWLLTQSGVRRALSPDVLAGFGATLEDFIPAASWSVPVGYGGSKNGDTEQILLRPARDEDVAIAACRETRHSGTASP